MNLGEANICLGPDTALTNNPCPITLYDSGFFDLNSSEGQYLSIYRHEANINDAYFYPQEIRAFQTPNLVNSSTVVITEYTGSNGTVPENLIEHLTQRTHKTGVGPINDAAGNRDISL